MMSCLGVTKASDTVEVYAIAVLIFKSPKASTGALAQQEGR